MKRARTLRKLDGWQEGWLVEMDGDFFVASTIVHPRDGLETLVFRSDSEGHEESMREVAGGRGMFRDEAIAHLERNL